MGQRQSRLLDVTAGATASRALSGVVQTPVLRRVQTVIAKELREALRVALNESMDNAYRDGLFPSRTGNGYRLIRGRAQAFGTNIWNLRGHITAPSYLVAQDRGATITPKQGRYLTIPVFEALRADGTPKLRSARSWKMLGSFVYRSKKTGQLYIARKTTEGKVSVLYILVEEVTLRKHKGWAQTAWNRQLPILMQEYQRIVMRHLTVDKVEDAFVRGRGGRRR